MAKYFIVWNGDRSEGFVADDRIDARVASSGNFVGIYSTAGNAFFECYEDEAPLNIEEVELP